MSDVLGALLTLLALGLLAAGGFLAAKKLLGEEGTRDRLAFAIAALLLAHAQAIGIALLLGVMGSLRLPWALLLQATLVVFLALRTRPGIAASLRSLRSAVTTRLRDHAVLAILTGHAVAAEAIRGLVRPPLSWDGLMYHLWLSAHWLWSGDLLPPLGTNPGNYYAFVPANGSLWFWWWMAPSHSELYVNLAAFPAGLLLALAAGGLARELGARSWWPWVSFATLSAPAVMRFLGAQYVDLQLGGLLLAGVFFGVRWLESVATRHAVLAALGGGLAVGTKVLGAPYAALAGLALALAAVRASRARGDFAVRVQHAVLALLIAAPLAGFFYARNIALGAEALTVNCEMAATDPSEARPLSFPRAHSAGDRFGEFLADGSLVDSFLGITRPPSLELGFGPLSLVWLLAIGVALASRKTFGDARLIRWVIVAQAVGHLVFWIFVPYANHSAIYANLRYLLPTLGMGLALGYAWLERKGARAEVGLLLTVAFVAQGLLQQHAEMPRLARIALAVFDLLLVVIALQPAGFRVPRRVAIGTAAVALLGAIALAPALAEFRSRDRSRAFKSELTVHQTSARFQADAWNWLEREGGPGDVAHMQAPATYFPYGASGVHLQRRVMVVNVNSANHRFATDYPGCEPRRDFDGVAWLDNLRASGVRYLYLARFVEFPFPVEDEWARKLPQIFTLRYEDPGNRIYEVDWTE